jgi:CBS domain containing-hemolysin-like protein
MSVSLSGWANERLVGPLAVAVVVAATLWMNLSSDDGNGGTGPAIVCAAVSVVAGLVVFGRIVPRSRSGRGPARAALYMSIAAFVSVAAFWSGLPFVLAPAALVLVAYSERDRDTNIAVVLSTIAILLAAAGAIFG